MIKDSVDVRELSGRIHHARLEAEIAAAVGPGVGWAVRYDENREIAHIYFEYDVALGYDPEAVKNALRAHLRDPEQLGDAELALSQITDAQKLATLQESLKVLTERIAKLES